MKNTDGLHWYKWDLHCHSPLDKGWYGKPSDPSKWDKNSVCYIDALKKKEIKVAAITDHFSYDQPLKTSMVPKIQQVGATRGIIILPGCELSIPDGKDGLHLIILFSEDEPLENIDRLLTSLHHPIRDDHHPTPITKYNLVELLEFLKKNPIKHILIWAHVDGDKGLLKSANNGTLEFLNYRIDCPKLYQWTKHTVPQGDSLTPRVFENEHPITIYPHCHIWASDGRCTEKPSSGKKVKIEIGEKYTWFLTEPSFEGLYYLLQDWEGLVKYGGKSPEEKGKKFFNKVVLESNKLFSEGLVHFNKQEIKLNSGLIAIIGPRGSGKSIFLDTIAALHNKPYWNEKKDLPSISPSEFKIYYQKEVNSEIESNPANVYVHVHQNDLNFICSDPDSLSKELLGILKLDPLDLEDLANSSTIKMIDQWVNLKNSIDSFPSNDFIQKNIQQKKEKIEFLTTTEIQQEVAKLKENQSIWNNLLSIEKSVNEISGDIEDFKIRANPKINDLNLELDSIEKLFSKKENMEEFDFSNSEETLLKIKEQVSIKKKQTKMNINQIEQILKKKGVNDYKEITNEILQYENQIRDLEKKLANKETKEKQLNSQFQSIIVSFSKIITHYVKSEKIIIERWNEFKEKDLPEEFKPIHDKLINGIEITTNMFFDLESFIAEIKDTLNGQKFKKKSGKTSEERINEFFNISNPKDFEKLVNNEKILSSNASTKINLQEFIETGNYLNINQERTFLNKIFNIKEIVKYYRLISTCSLNGTDIPHLSMGERGTLYLKLKLATSEFTRPIIIDQPEDDLDNDYIQNELVPLIKKLKNYRQIIIATHNANLVINAIAEQIIIASNNGEEISFESNSVVNQEIRKAICDILEGGEDAFRSRAKKYNINFEPKINP